MKKAVISTAIIATLVLSLAGCGKVRSAESETPAAETQTAPSETSGTAAYTGRQDGERFEAVIILEGMEETVHYEHVRNDTIGFEVDYDYESLARRSETGRERFVSLWDDPANPENYLEVTYRTENADTVAASVSETLSNEYEISRDDSFLLTSAGRCIRIDASAEKGGMRMPDKLQMVYIIPAADGCRVATAHYSIESAEGFGRRFHYMMDTFSVIDSHAERRLSDEQAVTAIKNYFRIQNPDLENVINTGDYPGYWDISSSDEQQIVVVFRSYTGAINRYYIDPVSGHTTVTELVPGIINDEQQTGEQLNVWEYLG